MWTVVYIASNRLVAETLCERLNEHGILTKLRPLGVSRLRGEANIEILVPESEVEEATEVLNAAFGS